MPLLLENFRDEETAREPLIESSSPLSSGTERMLWMLLGDFGKAGDLGGRSDLCERFEPLVSVRCCVGVCADCMDSTLLVRLGMFIGDAACTLTSLRSTGSGDDALGTAMPK